MRWAAVVIASFVFAVTLVGSLSRARVAYLLTTPLDPSLGSKLVVIPKGTDIPGLVRLLQREELISPSPLLWFYGRYLHDLNPPLPGEYNLGPSFTPLQLLERIEKGRVYEHTVTIPPGATLADIAGILEGTGLAEAKAFIRAAEDPILLQNLGIYGPSAEGHITPDVWALPRKLEVKELLKRLVKRFFDIAPQLDRAAERLGVTRYQLVTAASLVEMGPVVGAQRRVYAALLLERLQKGYALESIAADDYGRRRDGAPADPRLDPWNTTERPGLPVTPIGAPSLGALRAMIDPVDTEPVFMVRQGGGRYVFCPDLGCYEQALSRLAPGHEARLPKRFRLDNP